MRAEFIGQDQPKGFKKGHIYEIRTESKLITKKGVSQPICCLCVYDVNSLIWCPYSRLETMLQNWKLLQ
jgi:hypothetical protein